MCQLLNPFWLTHLSLSHQSTTTLKPSVVSWGSYWKPMGCGRTVSPFPHAHSTNRIFHFTWAGKKRCQFFFHSHPSPRGDNRSLFCSRTGWNSSLFSSCSELEERPVGHDSWCVSEVVVFMKEPFTTPIVCSFTILGLLLFSPWYLVDVGFIHDLVRCGLNYVFGVVLELF